MLSRREILRAAIAAGGAVSATHLVPGSGASAPPPAPPDTQRGQDLDVETQREMVKAIRGVDEVLTRAFTVSTETVNTLRTGFETFLRAHGKFPDFNEVGTAVFFAMYDWHIRNRQALTVQRQPDNRYTMQFMFTQLILRFDYNPGYIGPPYDGNR